MPAFETVRPQHEPKKRLLGKRAHEIVLQPTQGGVDLRRVFRVDRGGQIRYLRVHRSVVPQTITLGAILAPWNMSADECPLLVDQPSIRFKSSLTGMTGKFKPGERKFNFVDSKNT